ncbi:MAG TPA: Gfo/Idh/MocA family oxidoreductase [Clostridiaceae bacterium]|nr:Gfo/Idh/MocA family oxidoreductase [Clostridiaceae bacterium]
MKPKYGIIGCGNISRFHFNGLRKTGAEIVHISDINEQAATPYVKEFNSRFSKDYRQLIADPEVTVVSVLTSSKYHYDICMEAIKAGKDVICEKTMANNAKEAEEIAKASLASGKLFFVSYMKRFFPAVRKAKELLPRLGKIFSAQVRAYQNWGTDFYNLGNADAFEYVLNSYGGAVIKCAGSHMIDMTMNFLGRPKSLYANVDYVPGSKFDRKATALFEYDSGLVASFETATHKLSRIGYERNSWDEFIQINGVNGRIEIYTVLWDHPENNGALLVYYDNESETSTEYRFEAINPFDIEMAYFNECLEHRENGNPNVIDGFNVDMIIESMVESSNKKAPVEIDWKGI